MGKTLLRTIMLLTATVSVGGAALLAGPVSAQPAAQRRVEIVNSSSHAMIQFFASSTATADWGDDRLGPILPAGQTRTVTLGGGAAGGCLYDFKAVFDDGRAAERRAINVCNNPRFAFEDEAAH